MRKNYWIRYILVCDDELRSNLLPNFPMAIKYERDLVEFFILYCSNQE